VGGDRKPRFRLAIQQAGAAAMLPFLEGQDGVLGCRSKPAIAVTRNQVAELDQLLLHRFDGGIRRREPEAGQVQASAGVAISRVFSPVVGEAAAAARLDPG
jgi:hypothetical protein